MVFWTVVRMDNISLLVLMLISGSGRNMASRKSIGRSQKLLLDDNNVMVFTGGQNILIQYCFHGRNRAALYVCNPLP